MVPCSYTRISIWPDWTSSIFRTSEMAIRLRIRFAISNHIVREVSYHEAFLFTIISTLLFFKVTLFINIPYREPCSIFTCWNSIRNDNFYLTAFKVRYTFTIYSNVSLIPFTDIHSFNCCFLLTVQTIQTNIIKVELD